MSSAILEGCQTPVFCISEIPEATLDYFLQCIEKELKEQGLSCDGDTISDEVAFITSKDLSDITSGAARPAKAFTSPFLGESLAQVRDWFDNVITPSDGYTDFSFLVLDSQSIEDNTCVLVCTLEDELKTLRCDFEMAQFEIYVIEVGGNEERDRIRELFMISGEVMTKETVDVALKRLYRC